MSGSALTARRPTTASHSGSSYNKRHPKCNRGPAVVLPQQERVEGTAPPRSFYCEYAKFGALLKDDSLGKASQTQIRERTILA